MKRPCAIATILLIAGLLGSLEPPESILAQVEPEPSSEPGVVEERLREERLQKEKEERLEKPEPVIEEAPPPTKPAPEVEVRFLLKEVIIRGNTVLPASAFAPLVDVYLNKEVTVQDLAVLAEAIEHEYRRRGYITTTVYLPPQRIEEGRVTIQVLEGRLGQVTVEGNRYFSTSRYLWYWPLKEGQILQYDLIRRSLVRMNEHPDRQVQALLRPGKTLGETDIVLKVKDELPVHVGAVWDNQGTKPIGRLRYGFRLSHTNLFGLDDSLLVGTTFGEAFGALYTNYTIPLAPFGPALAFGFTHAQVSPRRHFEAFGVNGTAQTYTVTLTQLLWEREGSSLRGQLGFEFKESRTKVLSGTSRRDRLRILRVGPNLATRDAWGRWLWDTLVSFGLEWFGASGKSNPVASRSGADPRFFKLESRLTRVQRLFWGTQAVITMETQLSPSKLTPQEEFSLGGINAVRGYPEGDSLADQAILLRVEYLIPLRFLPAQWRIPGSTTALREQLQFVGFLDRAHGRLRAVTGDERRKRDLMGVGFGLRLRLEEALMARVEWGFNLGDPALTDDNDSRLHVGLSLKI